MPLLDHFRPPLSTQRHWESFHAAWAGALADFLNEEWLPEGYFAEEQVHPSARVEIDVATFEESHADRLANNDAPVATLQSKVWAPPAPTMTIPVDFPERFEVKVFRAEGGPTLVAAIELVSPGNKDRSEHRRAFTTKCANYLYHGISLVIIDIVTTRQANLHDELVQLVCTEGADARPPDTSLYAAAYWPRQRRDGGLIDIWTAVLSLGNSFPTLPLAISSELCIPLDLDATYADACHRRRLA
jgi:hypothetical protein